MLPLISFETGRKTQTQSSGQPDELRQQMEVWFYPRIETAAERPTPRAEKGKGFLHRRSSRAHQEAFCLLTRTYHRSPLRDSDQSSQLLISPNCVCDASLVPADKRLTRLSAGEYRVALSGKCPGGSEGVNPGRPQPALLGGPNCGTASARLDKSS